MPDPSVDPVPVDPTKPEGPIKKPKDPTPVDPITDDPTPVDPAPVDPTDPTPPNPEDPEEPTPDPAKDPAKELVKRIIDKATDDSDEPNCAILKHILSFIKGTNNNKKLPVEVEGYVARMVIRAHDAAEQDKEAEFDLIPEKLYVELKKYLKA